MSETDHSREQPATETTTAGQTTEAAGETQSSSAGMVSSARDIIERSLLLGVGAASLTVDRLQAVADEFVRRGQLTSKEGRDLVETMATRSRTEAKTALGRVDSSLQSAYHEVGLATRRELEDIEFRLRQVEHRLGLIERQLDDQSGRDPNA